MIDFLFSSLVRSVPKYSRLFLWIGNFFEQKFRKFDNRIIRTFKKAPLIPLMQLRGGGHAAFADWCFQGGVYSGLLSLIPQQKMKILDVGCGTGEIVPGILQILSNDSTYLGIDIDLAAIQTCQQSFRDQRVKFLTIADESTFYQPNTSSNMTLAEICAKDKFDVIITKALFDHLTPKKNEAYLQLFARSLRKNGLIIATFFVIDKEYYESQEKISKRFEFNDKYKGNPGFRYSKVHSLIPEAQLGVEDWKLNQLLVRTNLKVEKLIRGTWRDYKNHTGIDMPDTLLISHRTNQQN